MKQSVSANGAHFSRRFALCECRGDQRSDRVLMTSDNVDDLYAEVDRHLAAGCLVRIWDEKEGAYLYP